MAGTDTRIEPMTGSDLAQVLAEHDWFWDERDARFLHQHEFAPKSHDTGLTARDADYRIDGYPLGSTTPREAGHFHAGRSWERRAAPPSALALYRIRTLPSHPKIRMEKAQYPP